jgi:hypothetical protein
MEMTELSKRLEQVEQEVSQTLEPPLFLWEHLGAHIEVNLAAVYTIGCDTEQLR